MKNNLRPRYFLAGLFALSLFSFAYVNLHAAYFKASACCKEHVQTTQPVKVEDEEEQKHNIAVPDITLLSRVIDIAEKVIRTDR